MSSKAWPLSLADQKIPQKEWQVDQYIVMLKKYGMDNYNKNSEKE